MIDKKKSGLGKGLNAIISKTGLNNQEDNLVTQSVNISKVNEQTDTNTLTENKDSVFIQKVPIEKLQPNPYQPRLEVNVEKLKELASSIKEKGVIEPILVTSIQNSDNYEIIAGERRWRASKIAGLKHVPVIVKQVSEIEKLEIAIIENIQREDLNSLEEAVAIEQLNSVFGLTQDEISKKLGISRPAVANKLRLLSLPEEIKKGLLESKITEGHAKAILGLQNKENMIMVYKMIIKDYLSVRATEELVRRLNSGKTVRNRKNTIIMDDISSMYESQLREKFGPKAYLTRSMKGGKIIIKFENDEELKDIITKIISSPNSVN